MFKKKIYLLIFCLLSSIQASTAEVIKFEQGGASDAPGIVARGKLQIETTIFSYINVNKKSGNLFETGETLLRYGLVEDRLEARTRIFGLSFRDRQVGIDSMSLGAKVGLLQEQHLIPNADIIVDFLIPLDKDFYSHSFTHSYKLTMDKSLTNKLSAVTNLTLVFTERREERSNNFTDTQIPYVFGLEYDITEKLSFSEEIYGTWALSGHLGNQLGIASCLSYAFKDNLVGTTTVLLGLNDNTDPVSANMGLVYRL